MNTASLGLLAFSFVSMLVPVEISTRRSPLSTEATFARAGDDAHMAARSTRDQIVETFDALTVDNANFLNQLELSKARVAFDLAYRGATSMVNPDGVVSQSSVDDFHNYLDEFLRALSQLETGPWPNNSDYGKKANLAARRLANPLSMDDLKRAGRRMKGSLEALKSNANKNPLLQELDLATIPKNNPAELVNHTLRMIDRIEVITGKRLGLGPRFTTARDAARPLKNDLLRLAQTASNLLDETGNPVAERVREFEGWLNQSIDNSKSMRRNARAWNEKGLGARGKLVQSQLESLKKAFKSERRRWSKR